MRRTIRASSSAVRSRIAACCLGVLLVVRGSAWAGQEGGRGQTPAGGRGARPTRDIASPGQELPAGTGSIVGWIVIAGTGAPARRARVTLSGDSVRGKSATT